MTTTDAEPAAAASSAPAVDRRFNPAMLVTYSRFFLAPAFLIAYTRDSVAGYVIALLLVAASGATDFLDGFLARKRGQVSDLGKALDPIADMSFFLIVYVCMAFFGDVHWAPLWTLIVLASRELIQYLVIRTLAFSRGVVLSARLLGKLKTAVAFAVVMGACLGDALRTAGVEADWPGIVESAGGIGFGVLAVLSASSLFQYFIGLSRAWKTGQDR